MMWSDVMQPGLLIEQLCDEIEANKRLKLYEKFKKRYKQLDFDVDAVVDSIIEDVYGNTNTEEHLYEW